MSADDAQLASATTDAHGPQETEQIQHAYDDSLQTSVAEVWYLKEMTFRPGPELPPKRYKIITQNFNG